MGACALDVGDKKIKVRSVDIVDFNNAFISFIQCFKINDTSFLRSDHSIQILIVSLRRFYAYFETSPQLFPVLIETFKGMSQSTIDSMVFCTIF